MGGDYALGGDIWWPWYGGARGEARGGGALEGVSSNRLVRRIEWQKIATTKYILALTA
jgi:hypothetical protein